MRYLLVMTTYLFKRQQKRTTTQSISILVHFVIQMLLKRGVHGLDKNQDITPQRTGITLLRKRC
jgi:hypothetical protein